MGLVSEFWKLLDAHYKKLGSIEQYAKPRTQSVLEPVSGSTVTVAYDAMELLYVRNSAYMQSKLETLEGYEMVLFNFIFDLMSRDLRVTTMVIMFDKDTPSSKNVNKPRHKEFVADPTNSDNLVGEHAWFKHFKMSDTKSVRYIGEDNRCVMQTKLEITDGHMANRGFKQFLITLFCNGLQRNKDLLLKKQRKPFVICVRGHGTNNFELYWDGIADSVQIREPTLCKAYYKEAEMGMSAAVCDLISLGYSNIVVLSNDGDTFGPLALTIPKRTDENGVKYEVNLHWATSTQVFDVNTWHAHEERWCQSLGLEYGVYFSLVHYVALIVGGGNDYVKKLEKISAKYVVEALDKETYSNLLRITQTEDRIEIRLDETAFERMVQASYAKKRETQSGRSKLRPADIDAEKLGAMYRAVQWYLDYMVAGFIGEPSAFPPH